MRHNPARAALASALAVVLIAACAPADDAPTADAPTSDPAGGAETAAATEAAESTETGTEDAASADGCAPESLETLEPGTLTIATDEPAFPPWVIDDDPTSGEGFESAVAYAVAEQLGYGDDQVTWTRVPFNAAIQPGPKTFDFDINQFSITDERRQAVDFSSAYYDVSQAVIAVGGSPAAEAASLADLADLRLGAQVGTTSFTAIEQVVQPNVDPSVYNSNEEAKVALENGQIDALVVDLPTAFFITAVELEDGVVVGQLPGGGQTPEQFGLVLDKDSPLTDCVTAAVDKLREDGTLAEIEAEWLTEAADAPVLQ